MPNERGTADVDPESYADQDRFVRVLIRRLVTDQHLAEDLAQDTWLAALRQSAASMFLQRMWLGTVAKNFVLQAARGKVRRLAREKAVARSISVEPEEVLVDESLRRRVLRAVDDLDEPYRSAIRLRFWNIPVVSWVRWYFKWKFLRGRGTCW